MANTVNDTLVAGANWKAIATGIAGYITVSKPCFYAVSNVNPVALEKGHRLGTEDGLEYVLAAGESLWMKAEQTCVVVHTPGYAI